MQDQKDRERDNKRFKYYWFYLNHNIWFELKTTNKTDNFALLVVFYRIKTEIRPNLKIFYFLFYNKNINDIFVTLI